jgi:hypothetical protein
MCLLIKEFCHSVTANLAIGVATTVAGIGIDAGFDKLGELLNGTFGSGMGQVALNAGLAGSLCQKSLSLPYIALFSLLYGLITLYIAVSFRFFEF